MMFLRLVGGIIQHRFVDRYLLNCLETPKYYYETLHNRTV